MLVQWEAVPADLLSLNGKLPSGSRSGAGHVYPAAPASRKAAPRLPVEELTSLLFAQGERLTAYCFREQSSLNGIWRLFKKKKSFLVSANFKFSVGKKTSLQEIKTRANQPERSRKRAACLHVGNLAREAGRRLVPAGKAQRGSAAAR